MYVFLMPNHLNKQMPSFSDFLHFPEFFSTCFPLKFLYNAPLKLTNSYMSIIL